MSDDTFINTFTQELLDAVEPKSREEKDLQIASMENGDKIKNVASATQRTKFMATNMDALLKLAEERFSGNQNGTKFAKLADGKNTLRLLPPWAGELPWKQKNQHYINGKYYDCLDGVCPICARVSTLKQGKSSDDQKALNKKYGQNQAYIYNVLIGGEVKIIQFSWSLQKQLIDAFVKYGDLTDLANGRNLNIFKTKAGTTTYVVDVQDPSSISMDGKTLFNLDDEIKTSSTFEQLTEFANTLS
jgi:hypothetical protein